jgi:hypothetical protein
MSLLISPIKPKERKKERKMMHDYKGNIITPDKNLKFVHVPCTSVILNSVNSNETGTNQLRSRVHVEKPIVLQPVKKFPAFNGAQRFITVSAGLSFLLQLLVIFISLFILTYIHICVFISALKR